jgi:hypothetical protein
VSRGVIAIIDRGIPHFVSNVIRNEHLHAAILAGGCHVSGHQIPLDLPRSGIRTICRQLASRLPTTIILKSLKMATTTMGLIRLRPLASEAPRRIPHINGHRIPCPSPRADDYSVGTLSAGG